MTADGPRPVTQSIYFPLQEWKIKHDRVINRDSIIDLIFKLWILMEEFVTASFLRGSSRPLRTFPELILCRPWNLQQKEERNAVDVSVLCLIDMFI